MPVVNLRDQIEGEAGWIGTEKSGGGEFEFDEWRNGQTPLSVNQQQQREHQMRNKLKTILMGGAAAASVAVALAPSAGAITPDEWGMDDGIGVGIRTAGTRCLPSESHQWASPADGSRDALWCPPPAFVWIPIK